MSLIKLLLVINLLVSTTAGSNHDIKKFASSLTRCPYASEWLTKGPEEALNNLKNNNKNLFKFESSHRNILENEKRSRQNEEVKITGSCVYTNTWTNSETCIEYRGLGWNSDNMLNNCNQDTIQGVVTEAEEGCDDNNVAGWCIKKVNDNMLEATAMELSMGMGCDMISNACVTFAGGDYFEADGDCVVKESNVDIVKEDTTLVTQEEEENVCGIAPGPIGAAHQNGYSKGYRTNCPNTPAESSPYQWPLRWSANYKMESFKYNTDEISYTSESKVYYMLDKNWKRVDIIRQKGTIPFFLRSTEEEEFLDQEERSTIIHRGDKMYFISYYNGTYDDDPNNVADISNCTYLDLGVVGNIRPDWFLDKRGSATDVQYLGNQHVYYTNNGQVHPRLVKQWRKQDFANMYFTMSMKENVDLNSTDVHDTVHWPLILNIPGEGFGDDSIQYYSNHELLNDNDRDLFWLDEAYIQNGGICPAQSRAGEGGPPVGMEQIPSMLMKDEHSWNSIEYAFSPVWKEESSSISSDTTTQSNNDKSNNDNNSFGATTKASDHVHIQSCHDTINNNIQLQITYSDLKPSTDNKLPWVGLAFRTNEECAMFPRSNNEEEGDGTESILIFQNDNNNDLVPYQYYITRDTMSISSSSTTNTESSYKSNPLSNVTSTYSDIKLSSSNNDSNDSITLSFVKNDIPKNAMYLTYAIGTSNQFGYHSERTCFTVDSYPICSSSSDADVVNNIYTPESSAFSIYYSTAISASVVASSMSLMFMLV